MRISVGLIGLVVLVWVSLGVPAHAETAPAREGQPPLEAVVAFVRATPAAVAARVAELRAAAAEKRAAAKRAGRDGSKPMEERRVAWKALNAEADRLVHQAEAVASGQVEVLPRLGLEGLRVGSVGVLAWGRFESTVGVIGTREFPDAGVMELTLGQRRRLPDGRQVHDDRGVLVIRSVPRSVFESSDPVEAVLTSVMWVAGQPTGDRYELVVVEPGLISEAERVVATEGELATGR
ncbi:MAG: hypothetical protein AAF750_15570 [Planctomycetota bacterium]